MKLWILGYTPYRVFAITKMAIKYPVPAMFHWLSGLICFVHIKYAAADWLTRSRYQKCWPTCPINRWLRQLLSGIQLPYRRTEACDLLW